MLELHQVVDFYQRDRDAKQPVLDERIPDLQFARWSQNTDVMSDVCTTEFVGQFDIISRERKRILAEFRQNEIEVKFRSKTDDNDKVDEILQGKYRTDRRLSKSRQCFQVAQEDAIDVGFGCWRLTTENEDDEDDFSTNLEIRRETIPEAVRRVFFDCNSKLLDKSDASCCSVITSFTNEGYKKFLESLDIDTKNITFVSFDSPYESIYEELYPSAQLRYPFFTRVENSLTLLEFYNIEPKRQTYFMYLDDKGEAYTLKKAEAMRQELGEPIRRKTVTINECYKYICNGIEILKRTRVTGGKIPVIPAYGERNFVGNTENHYGIIKGAKDPQNLINSAYNYLASMMMFSPVPKPEFDPREIEGLEQFHEGAANSHQLAYVLRNKFYVDDDGTERQFPQSTYTMPAQIPPAVAALMSNLPQMTDAILNPGLTEDAFDTQASGVALTEINKQIGIQTFIYLDNFAEAMRRDGEVYAAMAAEVFDTERKVVTTNADNTTTTENLNKKVIDFSQFDPVDGFKTDIENKVSGKRFDVHFEVGASYQSRRDAVITNLKDVFATLPENDPTKHVVLLNILSKETGEGMDELNKYARMKILEMGLPGFEPQTEEEKAFVEQSMKMKAEQANKPDPQEMLGMAEMKKAEADIMGQQREIQKDQAEAQNKAAKVQIDAYNAETSRQKVLVDAEVAGANIQNKDADTLNKQVDAAQKAKEFDNMDLKSRLDGMSARELLQIMGGDNQLQAAGQ